MDPITKILSIGTLLVQISILTSLNLYALNRFGYLDVWEKIEQYYTDYWKELSFGLALLATTGSLYMSGINITSIARIFIEIEAGEKFILGMGYQPCSLCWFQRILMYPLVILFGVSWLLDTDVVEYAVPMATIGGGIAGYHYIIQRMEQFSSAGCSITSISCETEYTYYLGIVTIPLMAFTAFLGILLLNWKYGD